jgi:hypothetical protein
MEQASIVETQTAKLNHKGHEGTQRKSSWSLRQSRPDCGSPRQSGMAWDDVAQTYANLGMTQGGGGGKIG